MHVHKNEPPTLGLLQGWLDIGAMVILSLLCFIWAGQTSLGFCLLTCTFISLFSSGSGRTQQLFQPCKQALPVGINTYCYCLWLRSWIKYNWLGFFLFGVALLGGQYGGLWVVGCIRLDRVK